MQWLQQIQTALAAGQLIPYTGAGVLSLSKHCEVPAAPEALVGRLTTKASVPHKIRNNLTAAAQFIENFKHRKTVATVMTEAFSAAAQPSVLHEHLAGLASLPLWVHAWYDNAPQQALAAANRPWGMVQGVSQAEHFGEWFHYFDADGQRRNDLDKHTSESPWPTLLYQPIGSVQPAANFLVSDSDYVEVLTEIDIQTPIPKAVQQLRSGRSFLFMGCRFSTQLERIFAQQIIKRSSQRHWAVLPDKLTRNEARFLQQHNIERIELSLSDFLHSLQTGKPVATLQAIA